MAFFLLKEKDYVAYRNILQLLKEQAPRLSQLERFFIVVDFEQQRYQVEIPDKEYMDSVTQQTVTSIQPATSSQRLEVPVITHKQLVFLYNCIM
jgi:hypothetical protein